MPTHFGHYPRACYPMAPTACGDESGNYGAVGATDDAPDDAAASADDTRRAERLIAVLAAHHLAPPEQAKVTAFVRQLDACLRARKVWLRYLARSVGWEEMDILNSIHAAQRSGNQDEALWRAFLAAHFGRASANSQESDSAGRFHCGFETAPQWTWERVSADLLAFAAELHAHAQDLARLRYGNHRKFESKQPNDLVEVVSSFVTWVRSRGGTPAAAFATPSTSSPEERFHALYEALTVYRFGRTARFDLLCLLCDMALLPQAAPLEADSCYILGSSGPRRGMELLCGRRSVETLGALADDLARALSVPCDVMEDALCLWQKSV